MTNHNYVSNPLEIYIVFVFMSVEHETLSNQVETTTSKA